MKILQVCTYAAAYEGNFIKSLYALEKALGKKGHEVYYAFPNQAAEINWCRQLQKRTKVFFLPLRYSRVNPQATKVLKKVVNENDIDIIHSHFENYDISCKKAAAKNTKVFWHLHDPIVKARRPHKNMIVKMQYSHYGKGVVLLSVCDYYKNVAIKLGFDPKSAKTILNGIDLDRITYPYPEKEREYDFLTFGWDYRRKGVDLILNVLTRLQKEGYSFSLLLNTNEQALPMINNYFDGALPNWLTIGEHVEDVNTLFCNASTFVQASRRETFCYAVCEAAYAGMDVISSDISGLEWAHNVPSIEFFDNENEEQLYALLKKRLDKKQDLPKTVIEESREVIKEKYSVDVWVDQIINAYGL